MRPTTTTGNTSMVADNPSVTWGVVQAYTPSYTTVPEATVWRMIGEAFERYGNGEPLLNDYCIKVGSHPIGVTGMMSHALGDVVGPWEQRVVLLQRIQLHDTRNFWPPGKRYALRRALYCYLLAEAAENP